MDGAGVRICRSLGSSTLKNLDPYLMLDELKCDSKDAAAGFPDHPHRGGFVTWESHDVTQQASMHSNVGPRSLPRTVPNMDVEHTLKYKIGQIFVLVFGAFHSHMCPAVSSQGLRRAPSCLKGPWTMKTGVCSFAVCMSARAYILCV